MSQWSVAEWLHRVGVPWYDLEDDGGVEGLRQFKEGMVGRDGRLIVRDRDWVLAPTAMLGTLGRVFQAYRAVRNRWRGHLRPTAV